MELQTEVHFAQLLGSNNEEVRDEALEKVGKWLSTKSAAVNAFDEDCLMKLWKGIYYYFWHSDKPLVQEDAADKVSKLVHEFKVPEYTFLFIDTFFKTMIREWHYIDRYRLEKFLMLVRNVLHESFEYLKSQNWNVSHIISLRKTLKKTVLNPVSQTCSHELQVNIADIYMEELAKVGAEELTPRLVQKFLVPYCHVLIKNNNSTFLNCVSKEVFLYLINQEAGGEGFEEFPVLQFNASSVQKLLLKFANKPDVNKKHRQIIHKIVKGFQDYIDGVDKVENIINECIDSMPKNPKKKKSRMIKQAAKRFLKEEQEFSKEKKSKDICKKQKIIDL